VNAAVNLSSGTPLIAEPDAGEPGGPWPRFVLARKYGIGNHRGRDEPPAARHRLPVVRDTIEIDDQAERRPWGTHRFEVAPGEHAIAVSYPWVFKRRCGRSSVTVTVRVGELMRVVYRVGEIRYLPGKIRVEEPIPSARVVKIR
jgi:hypothetical protein